MKIARCCWLIFGLFWVLWSASAEAAQRHNSRFLHRTPSNVKAKQPVEIRGRIVRFDDLDYAELRFRKADSKRDFRSLRMKQRGSEHVGTIPAYYITPPGIEYYVVGVNFSGKARLLAGSPAALLQFLIIDDGSGSRRVKPPPRRPDADPDADPDVDPKAGSKSGKGPRGGKERLRRKLVVASATRRGRPEPIHRAPATVTVITAKDIRSYGWRTLPDILRFVAGIDINDRGFEADFGMRGINPIGSKGNGILFLLDGYDMSWRQLHQNFANTSWLSVDDIDRIEIIRGAATAMWGRNSLHGVIHIITKAGNQIRGFSGVMGLGALSGTHFLQVRAGQRFASGLSLYATFSMHRELRTPVLSPIWEFANGEKSLAYISPNDTQLGQNFYLKAEWRGLFFTLHQSRYDATAPMNPYSVLGSERSRFVTDRWIARAGWRGKLAKWGHLQAWLAFDRYTYDPGTRVEFNPLSDNAASIRTEAIEASDNRLTAATVLSASLHKFFQMQAGLKFEYLQATLFHFPTQWNAQTQGKEDAPSGPELTNVRFDGYLQLISPIKKWALIQVAARFSYDSYAGPRFAPQAGVVVTPGRDFFIKLNYAMGVRSPSLYELFHSEFGRYGNPTITDEEVQNIGLQVGWHRKKLLYLGLSGFFSLYNLPIVYQSRNTNNKQGLIANDLFVYPPAAPNGEYRQLINREKGFMALGGEVEARLYPIRNFEVRGFFGISITSEEVNDNGDTDRLPYGAGLYGGLNATYRYRLFRISLGLLYTGSKIAPTLLGPYPESRFNVQGKLPAKDLPAESKSQPVPGWKADHSNHPRAPTPDDIPRADGNLKLHLTLQFLNLFDHFDLVVRAQNILGLGMDFYDAGNPLLAPQKRFELLTWLRFKY